MIAMTSRQRKPSPFFIFQLKTQQALTCELGLVLRQGFEAVGEGGEDALHSAKHGAESQVQQHEEEERGPERAARQERHGLGEGDEREARALHTLNTNERVQDLVSMCNKYLVK